MTSKSKNAVRSYETEIEKSREEANWKKAIELAEQLTSRSPQHESLAHFLIGEGKLEAFLDEWPPIKDNTERAQRELTDARGYLTLATDESGKKAGVALDAHLLLGKLNYACGLYNDSLKNYNLAELNTLTEKELPLRSLRIVAESYAIKGLCLEQTTLPAASSRYKQAEWEAEMIRSFELASDLTLLYLQRANSSRVRAGPTLEMALQRVAILHIRAGRLHSALERYREMLSAVESVSTQALRLTLARQLAELLVRGATGQVYKPPERATALALAGTLPRGGGAGGAEGPWKPRRYGGMNPFVPQSEMEEALLVLLVCEAMAVRDAVLSQSPEFETARAHALHNACAVTDLLVLVAARWRQLCLVLESLERAMKFSFNCEHVWRQRALATAASAAHAEGSARAASACARSAGGAQWGAGVRAQRVMARAKLLCPQDAALRLVGAQTCFRQDQVEDGLALATEALDIETSRGGHLLARCYVFCGIGYHLKAQSTFSRIDRESANEKSLHHLLQAVKLDDNDHLAFAQLAQQYLAMGLAAEALDAAQWSLRTGQASREGLRACAQAADEAGRARLALAAARLARLQRPRARSPTLALLRLQGLRDAPAALATGKELLALLGDEPADELDATSDEQRPDASVADNAGSVRAGRALSSPAPSSIGAATTRSHSGPPAQPGHAHKARAWLTLAELCLRSERVSAAASCVAEAASLTPYCHLVFYTRGLVHAASGEHEEARQCFQNALALNPTHADSLVELGWGAQALGWRGLGEGALRAGMALAGGGGRGGARAWAGLAQARAGASEPGAAAAAAAAALQALADS